MPWWLNNKGEEVLLDNEDTDKALELGYTPIGDGEVSLETGIRGRTVVSPEEYARRYKGDSTVRLQDQRGVERDAKYYAEAAKYSGFNPQGIAEGFARGLTIGGSDLFLTSTGLVDPDELAARREHGVGTFIAEGVGAIAPAFLSGGSSAALTGGRAALSSGVRVLPASLAYRGSRAAGRFFGKKTGSRVAGTMIEGAAEGALFGAGQGVSQLAMSDDPVYAETAIATIGSNALMGGALGGGLGLLAGTASKGLRKYRSAKQAKQSGISDGLDAATESATVADDIVAPRRLPSAADQTYEQGLRRFRQDLSLLDDAARSVRDTVEASGSLEAREATKWFDDAQNSFYQSVSDLADEDSLLRFASNSKNAQRIVDDYVAATANLARQANSDIVVESIEDVIELGRSTGALPESVSPTNFRGIVDDYVGSMGKKPRKPSAPKEDPIADAVAEGAEDANALAADELAEEAANRTESGVFGSVSEGILSKGKKAVEAAKLAASLFGGGGSGAISSIAGLLGKFVRQGGEALDGAIDFALTHGGKAKAIAFPTAAILGAASFGDVNADEVNAPPGVDKTTREFMRRSAELAKIMGNPEAFKQQTRQRLAGVAAVDPRFSEQMMGNLMRQAEFLFSKMPKPPTVMGNVLQNANRWRPSKTEVARFARYVEAAQNPTRAVRRIGEGTLTMQDVETLRAVHPEIYARVQANIIERSQELSEKLPWNKRVQLSIFFGVPVDTALNPRTVSHVQGSHSAQAGESGGANPKQEQGARGGAAGLGSVKPRSTVAQSVTQHAGEIG